MKKKVIGFVHTHWDREWYREFEVFRLRLLEVFDNVLDMLTTGKLPVFYFDGQTSALEDYLEIRPEKELVVRKLIKEKKLYIGPMYCSIDEFLSSRKVMEKNFELGLKYAKDFGCENFLGYYSDTFGHTANVIPILKKYGIDTAVVWRGCGEIPAEFTWRATHVDMLRENSYGSVQDDEFCHSEDDSPKNLLQAQDDGCTVNCINLVRGYFNDFFHIDIDIEKRAELIKDNLDKISKYSGDVLLMPIGGDHLGVPQNLLELVDEVNKRLDDYEIELGSIFDYIELVKDRFSQYTHVGELLDNSKTFTLQGSFSSRLDLKRMNIESTHLLDTAERLCDDKNVIDYAYKLLLQNQAHDSIYGCSLDDVHRECVIRYKKINQICNTIISKNTKPMQVTNFGADYSGTVEFQSAEKLDGYQLIKTDYGFARELMNDTLRVPVTEDWGEIYTYLTQIDVKSGEGVKLEPPKCESDVFIKKRCIGNSNIFLKVEDDEIKIGDYRLWFVDSKDFGDSYNEGVTVDLGKRGRIISCQCLYVGSVRSAIEILVACGDMLSVVVELDNYSKYLNFKVAWNNSYTNHKLSVVIDTGEKIESTYSEDLNTIVRREFDPDYDIRQNLPSARGLEARTNTAPMQRGVWANNVGVVTKGITQYEVFGTELKLPILRSTDVLSNPVNPVRTTPAGPPYPLEDLKQLGMNTAEFSVFVGDSEMLKSMISSIFNYVV